MTVYDEDITDSISPQSTPKVWGLEEANQALPLVGRIVADIVAQYRQLKDLREQATALQDAGRRSKSEDVEIEAQAVSERLNELIDELGELDVQLKDLETGLVDFPGVRNGFDVLLCWKLGEQRIDHWHEVHAGFSGRRPVDEACK